MLKDIMSVQPKEGYQLLLCFEDGVEGIVKIGKLVEFSGIFAPLKDLDFFTQVKVNPELGTIAWPNHADLDPDVLYAIISGEPIPDYQQIGVKHGKLADSYPKKL